MRILVSGGAGYIGSHTTLQLLAAGHDAVIVDDFSRSAQKYDLIVNAVDSRSSRDLRRALTPEGKVVLVAGGLGQLLGGVVLRPFMKKKLLPLMANIKKDDLLLLKDMVDTGKLTPVIDRTYPLAETPEAIRYVEAGHARGKVVVTVMA